MKKPILVNGRGFSLIEILLVIGILMIVLTLSLISFRVLTRKADLDVSLENIIIALNTAKNKTLASEGASRYGVYFDTNTPSRYVLFKGQDYISRDVAFDEIYVLPSAVVIPSLSLNGGGNEVVFNRLKGDTNNYGLIEVQSSNINEKRTIYVYSSGEVSTRLESISGTGRIIDSRHVHFDLGWNIGSGDILRFNFVNAGQIKDVPLVDYLGSSLDWEGEFLINTVPQRFRIHSHMLNPSAIICIHRDRNKGANTEEVYVYIVQGGTEKEIAHYEDNAYATVYKGNYVWNEMEQQ